MPKSLPKPIRKQREVLYMPATGHSAVLGTATAAHVQRRIEDLLDSPSIFLFRLAHVSAEHVASLSPRLNILRHGLDDDLVMLREDGQAARKEGAK